MKIKLLSVAFLLFLAVAAFAQRKVEQIDPEKEEEQKASQKREEQLKASRSRWYDDVSFGGNLGGGISNVGSFFMIQPMAFYRITERSMAGLGVSYYYWSQDFISYTGVKTSVSDHAYGFNLFGRQLLFDPLFVHVEYMPLNFSVYNSFSNEFTRKWVPALYVGGGINQPISDRAGLYLVVLYDLLYDANRSFRGIPFDIRTGFYF